MDVFEDDRPEALQVESGQGCAVGPEVRIGLVPRVMEDSLEMLLEYSRSIEPTEV